MLHQLCTPHPLPTRSVATKPQLHAPSTRCMHSFGNVSPAAVQLSSTAAMRASARDIQPQSDDDDDVEESAMLLPRQAPSTPVAPVVAQHKAWWRIPVSWEVMVGFCTAAIFICYADRSNISTAIIEMSKRYDWDQTEQGIVLGAFFWGYAATQLLGGQAADRLGGQHVLGLGVFIWSACTFLTPAAALAGFGVLLVARVALGLGEGIAFPAVHTLIARTVPPRYRSTSVAVITGASYMGTAFAFGVAPTIITATSWEWVFYLFGGSAVVWLPLWTCLQLPSQTQPAPHRQDASPSKAAWSQGTGFWPLLATRPVQAICVAQYTGAWGLYGLLNWLPSFFEQQYHVEVADLGAYTLVPYVVQGVVGAGSGVLADTLISRGVPVKQVRRQLQVASMLGPAACLVVAASPVCAASPSAASACVTVGLGLSALSLAAVSVSHLDVAPNHAGVIFAAGNTAATLAGLVGVPLTGWVLSMTGSWLLVFGIAAAHYVVGAVVWWSWVGDEQLPQDALQ